MKSIYKILLIVAWLMIPFIRISADATLPAKVEAFKPSVVLKQLVFENELDDMNKKGDWGQKKEPREKKHWVVYSDRDKNTTYRSPDTSSPMGELSFNERVIIAKIQNGFALVYSDPKFTTWPAYSEKAVSKGWVPMENLLLWESCPADEKGIYQKALLAADLDAKKSANQIGGRFTNPSLLTGKQSIKTDMTFYYVMKTDKATGMKLLANQPRMDGNTNKVLYGWIDPGNYVPWNQRSCLEPNWAPRDVEYFNSPDGKKYPIYPDPEMKQEAPTFYRYGVINPDDAKPTSTTRFRMNAYSTRFPILDQDEAKSNVYKMTTFGTAGRAVINPDRDAIPAEKQAIINQIEKIKHINIIFVIDGTRSMKPYFAATKEAIKLGLSYFDPNKFTLRVGAVIYRDYTDGEYLTEKVPLSKPNSPQLLSFLDSAGKYGATSSPSDHTIAEALFKGLEVATDPTAMGFNKDESNIIVVIGDCGNDPNDTRCLTSEQIVKRLVANNMQLISFQVESNTPLAYQLFNEQMRSIIKDNLTKQYHALNPNVKIKFSPRDNGYDFKSNANTEFFIGSIRRPKEEVEIVNPASIAVLIEENIRKFAESVQLQLDVIVNGETGVSLIEGDENSQGVNVSDAFIISRIGEKAFKVLKDAGAAIAFTGYAPKQDAQGRNYWKPVAFMSSQELEILINRLGNLYNNANPEGDRKPYVDAVKALIRVMVPDKTEKEVDEMGIEEVMRLAAGLNEASDAVKGRSLKEIQDPRVVPADEYITLINTFKSKYKALRDGVKSSSYKYSYQTPNGQKFYWIPVEDLP